MDRISKEQRSKNMSAIRSKGNKTTEAELASLFRRNKIIGWRRHCRKNYGNPDFIFPKAKIAVFTDGCFWHGCKRHCVMPKSNTDYWDKKLPETRQETARSMFFTGRRAGKCSEYGNMTSGDSRQNWSKKSAVA